MQLKMYATLDLTINDLLNLSSIRVAFMINNHLNINYNNL